MASPGWAQRARAREHAALAARPGAATEVLNRVNSIVLRPGPSCDEPVEQRKLPISTMSPHPRESHLLLQRRAARKCESLKLAFVHRPREGRRPGIGANRDRRKGGIDVVLAPLRNEVRGVPTAIEHGPVEVGEEGLGLRSQGSG